MQDYRKLAVWKDAHALTIEVYRATAEFPGSERFGLTSQARRSAASVAANLVEGSGRSSARDFARFISISLGSLQELEYWLLLARDLGYISGEQNYQFERRIGNLRTRLSRFLRRLRRNESTRR